MDTSIWSLLLRRQAQTLTGNQPAQLQRLRDLVGEGRARLLGAVRQEILSGIRYSEQFARLQSELRLFPDAGLEVEDYETAAEVSNTCRAHGIAVTPIDMLLCSVALRRGWAIYTSDRDFERYAKHVPVVLYS
ncbi:MAG: PIN domain-containing protein [Candidatus Korobacteraceae bacterium]